MSEDSPNHLSAYPLEFVSIGSAQILEMICDYGNSFEGEIQTDTSPEVVATYYYDVLVEVIFTLRITDRSEFDEYLTEFDHDLQSIVGELLWDVISEKIINYTISEKIINYTSFCEIEVEPTAECYTISGNLITGTWKLPGVLIEDSPEL